MRILSVLLLIISLSACSSAKKKQQARINAEYDRRAGATADRTNPRQNDPRPSGTPSTGSGDPRPATATPVKPIDGPVTSTGSVPTTRSAGEWIVTSIKGKFLVTDSTTVRVYMDITAKTPTGQPLLNPTAFTEHFQIAYVMYPDYNNRDRLGYGNVALNAQSVGQDGDHLMLTFDVKRPTATATDRDRKDIVNTVLLTEVTEISTGTKARNDLPLRFRDPKLSDRYMLFDKTGKQPQLRNFVNAGDTVVIRDVNGTGKPLFGFRYKHEFDAASSPMNTSPRPVPKSLAVDSTLSITTNQPFVLPKEGLYYFMEDTTDVNGIGLVVADRRFPKMTRPEKLIKPVLYVSTSTEIGELNGAQDTKKAFDRYWLSLMSGNEDVAKRTLKSYFDRVEEANRLFTSYKEGWKTDKGMIYIVLGAPDRVQRNREREVWVYNRRANVAEINFTFTKKPNQFVEDHYELVRYIEYQPIWYPIVEAWRTGAIRE